MHPPDKFVPGVDFVLVIDGGEPSCYKEAMLARDHAKWELAMKSKLVSIEKNGTWDLVPLPMDKKATMAKIPYASACGSLMYAMVATRQDIAYAVGVVSQYMSNLGKKHWEAVKSILKYLSGTRD